MRKLVLSYANPERWRDKKQVGKLDSEKWRELRLKILERDNSVCQYCGYGSEKYQIVHHIDDNPDNNDEDNLATICQMCNLILHSGQGCVVKGIVDLYRESKFNQNEIIQITWSMRDEGKIDAKIIEFLDLKQKAPFKMDKRYLRRLFGFVTSRSTGSDDDMYDRWKKYHTFTLGLKRANAS